MALLKPSLSVHDPLLGTRQKSLATLPGFGQIKEKSIAAIGGFQTRAPPPPPLPVDSPEPSKVVVKPSQAVLHVEEDRPSPLDFDTFLPWVCKQMMLPELVFVTKLYQEKFVSQRKKQATKKKSAKIVNSEMLDRGSLDVKPALKKSEVIAKKSEVMAKQSEVQPEYSNVLNAEGEYFIPVTAYYDARNRLAEVAVTHCKIVRQLFIKSLGLCLPFQPTLTRMSITRCPLDQKILYEIGQLIPHSNFTEMIFDGTYVKQGNYYLVLEKGSQLKYLSLNRCTINDSIVEKICERLDHGGDAGKTLQILELSCNYITDTGAFLLGTILKKNRSLMHLNLAGNQITDDGAKYILDQLKRFMLTEEDVKDMRDRRREYYKKKAHVYEICYAEQLRQQTLIMSSSSRSGIVSASGKRKLPKPSPVKSSKGISKKGIYDIGEVAEIMTDQIMGGPFKDLFDDDHIIRAGDKVYCNGNFHFCSLNIAYNNVQFPTLKKLREVLKYQNEIIKPPEDTGLIKITLEGNLIPYNSNEFLEVDNYLKKAVAKKSEPLYSTSIRSKK